MTWPHPIGAKLFWFSLGSRWSGRCPMQDWEKIEPAELHECEIEFLFHAKFKVGTGSALNVSCEIQTFQFHIVWNSVPLNFTWCETVNFTCSWLMLVAWGTFLSESPFHTCWIHLHLRLTVNREFFMEDTPITHCHASPSSLVCGWSWSDQQQSGSRKFCLVVKYCPHCSTCDVGDKTIGRFTGIEYTWIHPHLVTTSSGSSKI